MSAQHVVFAGLFIMAGGFIAYLLGQARTAAELGCDQQFQMLADPLFYPGVRRENKPPNG